MPCSEPVGEGEGDTQKLGRKGILVSDVAEQSRSPKPESKGSGTESSANITAGVGDMSAEAFSQGLAWTRARRWHRGVGRSTERTLWSLIESG